MAEGAAVRPTGVVAFLFTDVEGSSTLWDRHPRAMASALAVHDRLLREAIESNGGYVFTTAGDSFAAAFARVDDAAAAAAAIQQAISSEPWPVEASIKVRIGLHVGEADERDGDYFGPAVTRCARVMSAAHGGQTVVTETVASMLAQSTGRDWEMIDRGLARLSGLAEPERIHELVVPGVGVGPETLRSPPPSRPAIAGARDLLGRTHDIETITDALDRFRLVTITGIGGIGKTSISKAVAFQRQELGDDVVVVELAAVGNDRDVVGAVARAAGITGPADTPAELAVSLAYRPGLLIVLDNCEHVLDATCDLVDVLADLPEVRVLATSRAVLDLPTEHVIRLSPLELDLATRLFIREAFRRDAAFDPGTNGQDLVEGICRQLDGIPLAIELAAARTTSLGLADIHNRLYDLIGHTRRQRGTDRHRTMAAAIDWSIGLLDPDIADGLGVLTVFAGSFDFEAAHALLADVTTVPPSDVIDELITQSLIEPMSSAGSKRYRLLEPVRQHAQTELVTNLDQLRHRHLEYYLNRLEHSYQLLGTTSSEPLTSLVLDDLANLEVVHNWALESNRIDDDLRLYKPLIPYKNWHEQFAVVTWATETLARPGVKQRDDLHYVSLGADRVHLDGGVRDPEPSASRLYRVADRATGDEQQQLLLLGAVWMDSLGGDRERARTRWPDIDLNDPHACFLYYFIGAFAYAQDAVDAAGAAREHLEPGIAWARSVGARNFESALIVTLAEFEAVWGDPDAALKLALESEHLADESRISFARAEAIRVQAIAALRGAHTDQPAASLLAGIIRSALHKGSGARMSFALDVAAHLLAETGNTETAALTKAGIPPQMYELPFPHLGTIPDHVFEAARARIDAEHLTMFDVAALVIPELEQISATATG